jgi:hypothetical protein
VNGKEAARFDWSAGSLACLERSERDVTGKLRNLAHPFMGVGESGKQLAVSREWKKRTSFDRSAGDPPAMSEANRDRRSGR